MQMKGLLGLEYGIYESVNFRVISQNVTGILVLGCRVSKHSGPHRVQHLLDISVGTGIRVYSAL